MASPFSCKNSLEQSEESGGGGHRKAGGLGSVRSSRALQQVSRPRLPALNGSVLAPRAKNNPDGAPFGYLESTVRPLSLALSMGGEQLVLFGQPEMRTDSFVAVR